MNNDVELIPVKGVLPSVQVQSDNVIYVPQAHKNKAGIVKEGDGVLIENGVVSLNRQTVEDMIDANKWVSYGFQQNLTEDEKGMARHNIGAGDNYFTGSYYDLTQKPHLNTNNTTGLDYGDEELNDTINLHKISKTGSFNDLKHVPQETLDFAESERQKSKNLLEVNNGLDTTNFGLHVQINNNIITVDGAIASDATAINVATFNPKIYAGKTYTFSFKDYSNLSNFDITVTGTRNDGTQRFNMLNLTSSITSTTITADVDYELKIEVYAGATSAISGTFKLQLEEGSVATDYQPYNGQITHNGDAPVVFAELERQKSKNLLYIKNTQNTTTITSYPDHIILNGTPNANTEYPYTSSTLPNDVKFEVGKTYTLSRQLIGGNGGLNFKVGLVLQDTNGQSLQEVIIPSGQESFTFVCNSNNIKKYSGYIIFDGGVTFTNAYYGLQIEEGSVATEYQPYNGQITHNGDASVTFAESERQKSETDGAIVHDKQLIEKSMTLIDKIYVPDESYSQLRFDNLSGNYNYKLIVIGSVPTASDGSIKINDTDLKSITLRTNSYEGTVDNIFGDTALIRVDYNFMVDADISVTNTYVGTPIAMEINNVSSTSDTKIYGRKTSSTMPLTNVGINSITIDIGTSKFYRGTQAFLYKLGDTK